MAGSRFPRVTNLIHAVFRLHDGQIVIDAAVDERHPENVRAAVVGGTGAYEGASGTFTTKPGRSGNEDTLHLLP
jgi:homoserine kinase